MEATSEIREKFWRHWCDYCGPIGIDPYLDEESFQDTIRTATGFAGRVRKGRYGHGRQVQTGSVRAALGGVNATIALDTGRRPLHEKGAVEKYVLPIQHMLKGFEREDPPTVKKLAIHPDLPDWLCKWGHRRGASEHSKAIGDLEMIAFYFLLRVGEYTAPKKRGRQPRTKQFTVNDVTFFTINANGFFTPLPLHASESELLTAVAATLRITDQKNAFKGACVHHGALEGESHACPVKALARRVAHIRKHTKRGDTMLCAFWDEIGRGDVTDKDMSLHMKFAAASLGYPARNIPLARIDTHSNRAGGACAMKLAGYDDESIRKMGRWLPSSNAFLEYIQQQLSGFSQGMSNKMRRIAKFTNMEGSANHSG